MVSAVKSAYERVDGDFYATPSWVVHALLRRVSFRSFIFDPCCGQKHIIEACAQFNVAAFGADLATGADFLADTCDYRTIVTNPPYGSGGRLAQAFIERALQQTARQCGQVAMLLQIDFDSGSSRRHLFENNKSFQQKIVLTKRIRWANLEQKKAGPSKNHAWFVWDHANRQTPVIRYAP